jgi:hypothetical protein
MLSANGYRRWFSFLGFWLHLANKYRELYSLIPRRGRSNGLNFHPNVSVFFENFSSPFLEKVCELARNLFFQAVYRGR